MSNQLPRYVQQFLAQSEIIAKENEAKQEFWEDEKLAELREKQMYFSKNEERTFLQRNDEVRPDRFLMQLAEQAARECIEHIIDARYSTYRPTYRGIRMSSEATALESRDWIIDNRGTIISACEDFLDWKIPVCYTWRPHRPAEWIGIAPYPYTVVQKEGSYNVYTPGIEIARNYKKYADKVLHISSTLGRNSNKPGHRLMVLDMDQTVRHEVAHHLIHAVSLYIDCHGVKWSSLAKLCGHHGGVGHRWLSLDNHVRYALPGLDIDTVDKIIEIGTDKEKRDMVKRYRDEDVRRHGSSTYR